MLLEIVLILSTSISIGNAFHLKAQKSFRNYNSVIKSHKPLAAAQYLDSNSKSTDVTNSIGTKILNSFEWQSPINPTQKSSIRFVQKTNGPVPRPYLSTLLIIPDDIAGNFNNALEEGIQWYLDSGGRIKQLLIASPSHALQNLEEVGCIKTTKLINEFITNNDLQLQDKIILEINIELFKSYILKRINIESGNKFILHNILGRISHDLGDFKQAAESYTSALMVKSDSSAVFRNLGSAYHADENMQMSFASYQQALTIDPNDALVYLKLAYFYEDLASKEWDQSFDNAIKCYQYYLDKVDPEDTTILTRLGNLYTKGNLPNEALETYHKALALDPTLHVAWFNSAHALIKLGGHAGARASLQKTLEFDPTNVAAKHMLMALSDEDSNSVNTSDPEYIRQLFDDYKDDYDKHAKKLMYAAPRVIRSEMANIYKTKYEKEMEKRISEKPLYFAPTYLSYMEKSLDILDLGCGTGLVGKWMKDYAKNMIGIDISEEMINKSRSKMLYTDLQVNTIEKYLNECKMKSKTFDLVIAADVFQYIGDLKETISKCVEAVRPGGYLIFTAEAFSPQLSTDGSETAVPEKGFKLQRNGRFCYVKSYISDILNGQKGINVIMDRDFSPRYEAGYPVPGYLFIVQKS
eukprot:gene11979-25087_t